MRDTSITIQRPKGTTIATGILVQVDQASAKEVYDHMQAYAWDGKDLYRIYTYWWNPSALIRRGDILIDEQRIDPESTTGAAYTWRVTGKPKDYELDHQEVYAEAYVGG
jgi:hypothetical protein